MNIPKVKIGIVAVSRDCFPRELSERRRKAVVACLGKDIYEAKTIIESERDIVPALDELKQNGVNALVVYLGNFGPEGPETLLAQRFIQSSNGAVMFVAAAEESGSDLYNGRGDAYCGMLNASYNLGLRGIKAYIPEYPVGTADEVAQMISEFADIARPLLGLRRLKIFAFGPRPFDFLACNAPIKPLFDLGVEIQENSELDLFAAFNAHADDKRIDEIVSEMASELGRGNNHPGILRKLAQYEITLLDWAKDNIGASEYFVFANKCWPAFQSQFGFVPCYVNSRLAKRGIPVACETDIYGALSEYILAATSQIAPTLLDINNTVPKDMYEECKSEVKEYKQNDLFMGFHCGNTSACYLTEPQMQHQLIMKRALEPDGEPNITRGTLEGALAPNSVTLFRLQSTADTKLRAYVAEGEILNVNPKSFGAIGVFAVKEMGRFYRHVLIENRFPHHAGVGFAHKGKALFELLKLLGVCEIGYNQPKTIPYKTENPFA